MNKKAELKSQHSTLHYRAQFNIKNSTLENCELKAVLKIIGIMNKDNIILTKSFDFALQIIELYKQMKTQNEYVLSKQVLRSGTSIGASVEEAMAGISKRDFTHKMSISSKEARETKYWLRLIQHSQIVNVEVSKLLVQVEELIRILTSIVKTSQGSIK